MAEIGPLAAAGTKTATEDPLESRRKSGLPRPRVLSPSQGMTFWRQKYIVTELDI
jgi:hypothetical protein